MYAHAPHRAALFTVYRAHPRPGQAQRRTSSGCRFHGQPNVLGAVPRTEKNDRTPLPLPGAGSVWPRVEASTMLDELKKIFELAKFVYTAVEGTRARVAEVSVHGRSVSVMSESTRGCVRACVRACADGCVCACVNPHVRACVRAATQPCAHVAKCPSMVW